MTIEPGGVCGAGRAWPGDRDTSHWLQNTRTIPAIEVSVDIGGQSWRRFAKHGTPRSHQGCSIRGKDRAKGLTADQLESI